MTRRRVLVDDHPSVRNLLRDLGHEVLAAESSLEPQQLLPPAELVRMLPAPKRTRAFVAQRNDWRHMKMRAARRGRRR